MRLLGTLATATATASVTALAVLVAGSGPAAPPVVTSEAAPAPAASVVSSVTSAVPSTVPALRGAVVLRGDVRRPRLLTRSALARLDQQSVTTTYTSGGRPTTRTFTGPLLLDVARLAEPRVEEDVSNDVLSFAIRATATDGYRAVVAWGEIDPGFAGTRVLVALTEDGVALDRPRLVVPGDARGGRYVTDVVDLTVQDLGGRR